MEAGPGELAEGFGTVWQGRQALRCRGMLLNSRAPTCRTAPVALVASLKP